MLVCALERTCSGSQRLDWFGAGTTSGCHRRVCIRARHVPSRVEASVSATVPPSPLVILAVAFAHPLNMSKRGASPPPGGVLIKRARSGSPAPNTQIAISSSNDERQQALIRTVKRTSSLEAPIISLSGSHGVRILLYSLCFTHRSAFREKS